MEELARRVETAIWVTKHVKRARAGSLRRDDARNLLRRTVELYARAHGIRFLAWSFLPSRVDLIIADPTPVPLEKAMSGLFGYFTRRFNFRYRKSGALLRSRFLWRRLSGTEAVREAMATVLAYPSLRGLRRRGHGEEWSGLMTLPPAPPPVEVLEAPLFPPPSGSGEPNEGGPLHALEVHEREVTDHGS